MWKEILYHLRQPHQDSHPHFRSGICHRHIPGRTIRLASVGHDTASSQIHKCCCYILLCFQFFKDQVTANTLSRCSKIQRTALLHVDRIYVKKNFLISGILQNILNFCFFRNFLVFPSNIPQADQLPDGWVKGSVRILCDLQKTFQVSGKLVEISVSFPLSAFTL